MTDAVTGASVIATMNLPAIAIAAVTMLVLGISESALVNNIVVRQLSVVVAFIVIGAFYRYCELVATDSR